MRLLAITALAACGFHGGGAPSDGHADGAVDALVPPRDALECFGADVWTVCVHPLPTMTTPLPSSINTMAGSSDCGAAPAMWSATQPESCFRGKIQRREIPSHKLGIGGRRNHGRIVGCKRTRGEKHRKPFPGSILLEALAQFLIGRDASGDE